MSEFLWYMENKINGCRIFFESEHKAKSTYSEFPDEVKSKWLVSSRSVNDSDAAKRKHN